MIKEISKFSQSDGHGSLVVLAIMSHGNERGDIHGLEETTCSVQQVIESLCQGQSESVVKVK